MDTRTEFGSVVKEISIDASPEIVYAVVSEPKHISHWWADAEYDLKPGSAGQFTWGPGETRTTAPVVIVEAEPGKKFSFYWVAPPAPDLPKGATPDPQNAMLVTFELAPRDGGTLLTVSEHASREIGWEAAVLEQYLQTHGSVWDQLLQTLADYAMSISSTP